jgi:hypothetical protein
MGIGIHVVTHARTYNLDHSRDWRTLAEDGVDSAYESEKTRERVMRAVGRNASLGRPHGRLLFGYRRTYDDRGNFTAQEINEDQAWIIRDAAQRISDGESCYSIASDYNTRGITASMGGTWDLTQIKRLVTNPGYIGKRVHQGKIVGEALWPAILDEPLYWTCYSRLHDPARKTMRDCEVKHLLTGIARCGVCDCRMRILNNRSVVSYVCRARFHVTIPKKVLEDYILPKIIQRLFRLDVSDLAGAVAEDGRKAARVELAQLQSRLEEFTREAAFGGLSAVRLGVIERELEPLIADAQRRTRSTQPKKLVYKVVENPQLWEDATMIQKREIVSSIMTIYVDPIGRGRRGYDVSERVRIGPANNTNNL